jgi:signal transduction histidine kinase
MHYVGVSGGRLNRVIEHATLFESARRPSTLDADHANGWLSQQTTGVEEAPRFRSSGDAYPAFEAMSETSAPEIFVKVLALERDIFFILSQLQLVYATQSEDNGCMPESAATSVIRGSLGDRVLAEQLALMCKLTISPLLATVVIGALFAALIIEDAGLAASAGWYCALLTITFVRWQIARVYLAQPQPAGSLPRWRSVMILFTAIAGAIWSVPGSFMLPGDRVKEIVATILIVGTIASSVGAQAPVRHAYLALLIPFALPYAIWQFALGGQRVIVGLAMLIYIPIALAIAYRQTDSVERQIRLAFENEALAEELRRERDRTNQANIELQAQIEQQRRSTERIAELNRDLESQAQELKRANSDLEGFSYSVSHDLRAPLRAVHGFASILTEKLTATADSETKHFLKRISENVLRMSTLIDALLAFSKYGRQPLARTELDMEALARTAAAEAVAAHESSTAEIVIEAIPRASGDPQLILQVWRNLLDNAVKYSSKGATPRIVVRGSTERERVVYEVSDNGVGFDPRYSDTLFGVFQRLHSSNDYPGSGVGLTIVQRIVMRHGGQVWASSQVHAGATFGFALPTAAESQDVPAQ